MKRVAAFLFICFSLFAKTKVLHLTFHPSGCPGEIMELAKHFDWELDTWIIVNQKHFEFDPSSQPVQCYNMTKDRAERIFNKHKEAFESYDLIITSDTASLSRIFLQHNWKKPLLVWVCNRFDSRVIRNHWAKFPDKEYYELFQAANKMPNVKIIGYTNYEKVHAENHKQITSIEDTIPPTGLNESFTYKKKIPSKRKKEGRFFIRKYINEAKFALCPKVSKLDIPYYTGPYGGSADLKDFKGMIHIPVVMANFFLWENLKHGIVHFIPSKKYYRDLYENGKINFWDWTNGGTWENNIDSDEIFAFCDWYNPKLKDCLVYFDSMEHLKELTETIDYDSKREYIRNWHKRHVSYCLKKWEKVFSELLSHTENAK